MMLYEMLASRELYNPMPLIQYLQCFHLKWNQMLIYKKLVEVVARVVEVVLLIATPSAYHW